MNRRAFVTTLLLAAGLLLAVPGASEVSKHPALLQPPVPPLRSKAALALPGGLHPAQRMKLLVPGDHHHVEVHDIQLAEQLEHAANLDVYLVDDGRPS